MGIRVCKFGGSSVATFERMRAVATIIAARAQERPTVVVVLPSLVAPVISKTLS